MSFAQNIVSDAVIIRLRREEESLDNIKQFYVKCDTAESKYEALANLYGSLTIGQTMVFCHVSWFKFSVFQVGRLEFYSKFIFVEARKDNLPHNVALAWDLRPGSKFS